MKVAYVDTSCLVAVAFGERGATAMARRLAAYDQLVAANLLEAELRSAYAREGVEPDAALLGAVSWVIPDRPLGPELARVLNAGRLRGADSWHLAAALYLVEAPAQLAFLTLDHQQEAVARALGFQTLR